MLDPDLLPKSYEPATVEPDVRRRWEEGDLFRANARSDRPAYSMVIPPPNVTGSLHMGHALNNTLQDILARYKRMDGFEVLWLPGTDHAGIATQNVVERDLAKEGRTRHDLGREKFLERVWKWKETYGGRILEQLRRLGCSCDFSRTRFTMDEGLSAAVREVFVRLWEDGLLYRGDYIVNWCPRCGTALSDIEVVYKEIDGAFYHIRYPFVDGEGSIVVATTRPETMLGDTAVAVHPDDERHRAVVGKKLRLPIVGREIPIVADSYVDPSFGTGLVKITPAHDPNDFLIGQRHSLPLVNILNADATLNENAGEFRGQDRFEARKGVVARLEAEGFLIKVEPHKHNVGHCYRCSTQIEPYVSKQWFIRMKPLAEPAIAAVTRGHIRLHPERWKNDYLQWMENIRDWCVSRQIWWGHRIPAWYCESCQATASKDIQGIVVAREEPRQCPVCGSAELRQDEDVLDTWFSSALWPFSTMGWPAETDDLKKFYPTSVLSTGFDILTFWVSRMIVMGLKFRGPKKPWMDWSDDDWARAIPFRDVPIHALIRTETGEKMSKSKGNVIDPLVMMDKFGTDAVRFTLAALAAQGRDIRLSEQRFEGYRHFANKLWNASRFVLMNVDDSGPSRPAGGRSGDALCDMCNAWILGRLDETVATLRSALDAYEFDAAARKLYDFIWGEFCDWYIEISKIFLTGSNAQAKDETKACLLHVLTESLKLLHPFMPFITEELWERLPPTSRPGSRPLAVTAYSRVSGASWAAAEQTGRVSSVIEIIRQIRNVRTLYRIPPNRPVDGVIRRVNGRIEGHPWIQDAFPLIERLAKCVCRFEEAVPDRASSVPCVFAEFTVHVQLSEVVDLDQERNRIRQRLEELGGLIEKNERRLKDAEFLNNAPDEVVETMRDKTEGYRQEKDQLAMHLA